MNTPIMTVMSVSTTIRNRRGSTMSASAPAGNVNRNIGRLLATCTIDTARGAALRFVINHAEAVSDIAMPVKANVLATHIAAKAGWPNAPKRERRLSVESTAATEVELTKYSRSFSSRRPHQKKRLENVVQQPGRAGSGISQRCRSPDRQFQVAGQLQPVTSE